jgi:uncharacterized Zn-finger protein
MSEATAAASVVEVRAKDVHGGAVYCPNPKQALWSEHPRVYINVAHGEGRCPYCGTVYRLAAGETLHSGH